MTDDWQNDPYVQKWLRKLRPRNRENCLGRFPIWLDFCKLDPTEQIQIKANELRKDPLARGQIEDLLIDYMHMLEGQGYKVNTIRSRLSTVRSFFSHNRVPLTFSHGDLTPEPSEEEKKIKKWVLVNEEIRVLYNLAKIRDKALMLVAYQSGLLPTEVKKMRIEDLEYGQHSIYDLEGHLYYEILREKTNIPQKTCISAECIHDIRLMLRERGTPEKGFLFITQKGQPVTERSINDAMTNLCGRAFGEDAARKFKTKNFRDSFNDSLLKADIKQEIKDRFMGHKPESAKGHYECSPSTILMAYEKAFRYMSVNGGHQAKADLERIDNTVLGLTDLVNRQQEQIKEMMTEMKELKKYIIAEIPASDLKVIREEDVSHYYCPECNEIFESNEERLTGQPSDKSETSRPDYCPECGTKGEPMKVIDKAIRESEKTT